MRKNMSIHEVEEKTTKKGQLYWACKTNQGPMSCFDAIAGKELIKGKGHVCDVEVQTSGDYTNILAVIGIHSKLEGSEEFKESGPSEGARLRRITDCVLAGNSLYETGVIKKEEIFEHAKGLYEMIGEIDANKLQD